jgi:predicted nucleic acid-binding protein
LDLLPKLAGSIVVPPAVVRELSAGTAAGYDVPVLGDIGWIDIRQPAAVSAERLIGDLGPGETEVLMLAMERPDAIAVVDDKLARRVAETLNIRFTGTLGILLDAKRKGLIDGVAPLLDRLQLLAFRVSPAARALILRAAGES